MVDGYPSRAPTPSARLRTQSAADATPDPVTVFPTCTTVM